MKLSNSATSEAQVALHCVIAIIVAVYIASVSFIEAKEK